MKYRSWQFWRLVSSKPLSEPDKLLVIELLDPIQTELFFQQSHVGQQHAVKVLKMLLQNGQENRDLLVAALFHDIGKIRIKSHWWYRPLVVVLGSIFPGNIEDWGNSEKTWCRPFVIKIQHARWGAELSEQVGCSATTSNLILYHHDRDGFEGSSQEFEMLNKMIWADDQS